MKLETIVAGRHIFEGEANGKPWQLSLNFGGGRSLRLQVAPDGERMVVDDRALDEPVDMEEYGRTDTADVTRTLFPQLSGLALAEVRELVLDDERVGVTLSAIDGGAFHFWVAGDELYWGDDGALSASEWPGGMKPVPLNRIEL